MGKLLVRFCEGLERDSGYGGHIVAPPGNQADNGENKPLPKPRGVSFLLKNWSRPDLWGGWPAMAVSTRR